MVHFYGLTSCQNMVVKLAPPLAAVSVPHIVCIEQRSLLLIEHLLCYSFHLLSFSCSLQDKCEVSWRLS